MKLCLNMIVKNESERIIRALDSVIQFISCYAITDTGSTDDTPEKITEYLKQHKIPGVISYAPFKNWSQARNNALLAARGVQKRYNWDWVLLMDADMSLVMQDLPAFEKALDEAKAKGARSLDMEQRAGTLHYGNRRLLSATAKGKYVGVTHEYLDVDSFGFIEGSIAYFDDRADGSNRANKCERDIALLLAGIEAEPNNGRYYYYLAQSYRDKGDLENAKLWYKKRVDFGGWVEEQWNAQVNYAHCLKDQKDEGGFLREMIVAYKMRPSRAETLYDLARYYREKDGWQVVAALFAEIGLTIPRSKDLLFLNDYCYEVGLKEEFSITGFYNEQKRGKAYQVCSDLSLQPGPYGNARENARFNLYFYIKDIASYCPSFQWRRIPFDPPENWIALNPSVTNFSVDNRLWCIVRTVNYRIDDEGRYIIRGTDGTANDSNPINTRNYLLDLGRDPMVGGIPVPCEIVNPTNMPCEFKPVIGFEDMRLFSWNDELWTSSTVRQIHWDGNCEQVLAKITRNMDAPVIQNPDWKRMLREPRETEKNWAPFTPHYGPHPLFMWRPGVTINDDGKFWNNNPPPITTDIISGGSQLVKVGEFWIALVHSARLIPGSSCRYYFHRWAVYDQFEHKLLALSRPFVFHDRVIEFAAGLAQHPEQKDTLVISYGFKDNEARVATVNITEVMRMIWTPYN